MLYERQRAGAELASFLFTGFCLALSTCSSGHTINPPLRANAFNDCVFLMKRVKLIISPLPLLLWKDFKYHLVRELGDCRALPVLVGLQPAADPAAASTLLLVLPHSEDSVPSHLQRKGESQLLFRVPLHNPSIYTCSCRVFYCVVFSIVTFDFPFLFSMLTCNLQGGEMESITCK